MNEYGLNEDGERLAAAGQGIRCAGTEISERTIIDSIDADPTGTPAPGDHVRAET